MAFMEQLFFQGLHRAKHDLGRREEAVCDKTERRRLSWGPRAGVEWAREAGTKWINEQDKSREAYVLGRKHNEVIVLNQG